MYRYEIIMVYSLNLHSVIDQSYLHKAKRKTFNQYKKSIKEILHILFTKSLQSCVYFK